ncbi:hypothetical protein CC86DRAFT_471446 [Ophiobolus disseminans]|uniref:SWI/SNF family DNA-dependent ATPase Ris1 n=1 Tax=Ophiobolus disseminans TaxID=1469910 RepID=A0A6A6ZJF9_9PLEO|nr:hypothetical protein CC86DRAFT_471446 [Ophiobolus disseminans]
MNNNPASPAEVQHSIDVIGQVLRTIAPGHPDSQHYHSVLEDLYRQLAELQRGESSAMGGAFSYQPSFLSVQSNGYQTPSRKRSLEPTASSGPDPKRVSANPSPQTPGTPSTPGSFDAPVPQQQQQQYSQNQQQQWSLPSRPYGDFGSNGMGRHPSAPFYDLTVSDPPSPEPFPELEFAFRDDGARSVPADAFTQEIMDQEDLAQFLMNPTPAGGGYAFQQQNQQAAGALDQPLLNFDFATPDVPYLPGPQVPHWVGGGDSDEEQYGDFPLNINEADSIEQMLQTIQDTGREDREETPRIMKSRLKEYQKIGLTWLLKMEAGRNKGGILADEMGLGKTVQALALICARPSQDAMCKTTLIIAPVALMRQWQKEIVTHVEQKYKLSVYLYHGNGKKADFSTLRQHDVVLTTFGTLTSEFKQKESSRESLLYEREQNEPGFRRKPKERLALLGHECMWYRIIVDEAHMLKNRNSIQSKASVDLQARHRLCLTGTPMMNSIEELYPLLRFLRIDRYNDWKMFSMDIAKPAKHSHPETRKKAMNRVQILLKAVMLRRQKCSEVDGKPILNLPAKHTAIDTVEFSDDEQTIYKALETKSQIQFNKYLKQNSVSSNYACILVLLLRLRQACCHPHLIKDLSQPATEGIAEDDLLERARYLDDKVVERLKAIDSFECPCCFEADPNPTIIIPCGHTVCGECVQKLVDPSRPGQELNDENTKPKCPHCRGELKAKLITDYKHFCRIHDPEKLDPDDRIEQKDKSDESDSDSDEDDDQGDDIDEKGNLADFVVSDEDEDDGFEAEEDDEVSTKNKSPKKSKGKCKGKGKSKGKDKARAQPKKTLAQLKKESLRNKEAKRKYLRRLDKTWVPSAKILETVELLTNIRNNDPTEKTLVFSQFTSLLDLVEVPLVQNHFRYQRYDGSMSMDARADAVEAFMESDDNIMLVSLKAGNAGLNLWRASQVIMLDPFWNPFVEEQAIDRAHRMPQNREVTVHRILVPETVEDRICTLQDKKREIIGAALDENTSKGLARLSVRELKFLFGMG